MSGLSPPEQVADQRAMRRILGILMRSGGCPNCIHRTEAWGKTICSGHAGRSFPLCAKDGQAPEFKLDEETLR